MDEDVMRALGLLGPQNFANNAMGGGPGLLGPTPQVQQTPDNSGQQPMSLLSPNQMPQAPGSSYTPPPSWMDRLKEAAMPTPPGMSGLLGPDDLGRARGKGVLDFGLSMLANARGQGGGNAPSFGQALLGGVQAGQQGYEKANQDTIQGKMTGMQLGQQQHILLGRKAIGDYLAQHAGDSLPEQMNAIRQAYIFSAALGDHESMKVYSPLLEKDPGLNPKEPQAIPAGGRTVLLDPRTHQPIGVVPHTPAPMSDEARGFRQDAADARNESMAMRQEQQQAMRESRLVQQYEQMSKPFAQAAINAQALNENRAGAMKGDPIAQQTALQDFIKLNLPGQMVSAGELHQYAGLMGLGDKGEQLLQRLEKGTPLSAAQMKAIYQHADGLVAARRGAANYVRTQMQTRAKQYGVDPEAFVDHFGFLPQPSSAATSPADASLVDRHYNKSY